MRKSSYTTFPTRYKDAPGLQLTGPRWVVDVIHHQNPWYSRLSPSPYPFQTCQKVWVFREYGVCEKFIYYVIKSSLKITKNEYKYWVFLNCKKVIFISWRLASSRPVYWTHPCGPFCCIFTRWSAHFLCLTRSHNSGVGCHNGRDAKSRWGCCWKASMTLSNLHATGSSMSEMGVSWAGWESNCKLHHHQHCHHNHQHLHFHGPPWQS